MQLIIRKQISDNYKAQQLRKMKYIGIEHNYFCFIFLKNIKN